MDTLDYSKNYAGEDKDVKTTKLILTKADGSEVGLSADDLEALIDLLD